MLAVFGGNVWETQILGTNGNCNFLDRRRYYQFCGKLSSDSVLNSETWVTIIVYTTLISRILKAFLQINKLLFKKFE